MHNNRIPSAEEIRAQGPIELVVQLLEPDDPSLPPTRCRTERRRKVDPSEQIKLEATRRFGGLLPVIDGNQYWQCPSCLLIHSDRQVVRQCCGQPPNQVQICLNCLGSRKGLFRIGACQCRPQFHGPGITGPSFGGERSMGKSSLNFS
jgi:hypothetical protein